MAMRLGGGLAMFLAVLLLAQPLSAAAGSPEQVSWYVVRPGDTLESLSARYLGSAERWRENYLLNPDVKDPNLLQPGQRLRILMAASGAPASARIESISARVDNLPLPFSWRSATAGDLLIQDDGVRTYDASSAEIRFGDGTNVVATENSLVFVRGKALERARLAANAGKTVEIVRGGADLEARKGSSPGPDVEILIGGVRAAAAVAPGATRSRSRVRRPEAGGANVMVYEGSADVAAGGATVAVPEGMGTVAPVSGPPSPPEPLLEAPQALAPQAAAQLGCVNPRLRWQPVTGASGYAVEVCRDQRCAELVELARGLSATAYRAQALPVGPLFWRVTAIAASGLDGYPSTTRPLTITGELRDDEAPTGTLKVTGNRLQKGGVLFADETAYVESSGVEAESRLGFWWQRDGTAIASPVVGVPLSGGSYVVGGSALDACGNEGTIPSITFQVDDAPPEIRWEVRQAATREGRSGSWRGVSYLDWRQFRNTWQVWKWQDSEWRAFTFVPRPDRLGRNLPVTWRVVDAREGEGPELVLAASREGPLAPNAPTQLRQGQELHIWAEDRGCGVETLSVRRFQTEEGPGLRIQAADCFGHESRLLLPFAAK
jgi:hypothetical protein